MKTCNNFNDANSPLFLDKFKVGDMGIVSHIASAADALFNADPHRERRLMEIGFIPGEPVEVLHRGFFGGEPIAVRVGHSTFALRRFEAALISVLPIQNKQKTAA